MAIVSVVDCSEAAWPFEGFWRDGLEDASQREGFTIYGDWEGKMRAAFGFPRGGTSFALLGPDGKALYVARDASKASPRQYEAIKQAISRAAAGATAP